jgi:hypothetical protein
MVSSVKFSRLGPLDEIDSGAFGTVFRLSSYSLPGFTHLAYKEYAVAPESAEVDNLTALVEFRARLDTSARAILDDAAAWPLQLVTRGGAVCGFVMQLIPPEFFGEQLLPSGRTVQLPVKSQWLVVDPAKADAAGIRVPRADDLPARIVLCAKLAHMFGVLHRAGLVYGDLSLNNAMFSAATPPRVMLVDCDAAQSPVAAPIAQAHTPDWTPPEFVNVPGPQDIESDRYKLALFVLRVLAPGPHASQTIDPSRMVGLLDFDGNAMMRDGLSGNRSARPSAKDWFEYLTCYLAELTSPPAFSAVTTDRALAPVGSPVTVRWQAAGASRVSVTASDGHTTVCDAAGGAGSCRMSVTRSGPFTLTAENRYGAAVVESDAVIVLQPPTIARVDVAPIVLPPIRPGTDDLSAGLAAVLTTTSCSPQSFALPDLAPLQSLTICPLPDAVTRPAAPLSTVDVHAPVEDLLAAVSADARAVVDRARAQSAAAVPGGGDSV